MMGINPKPQRVPPTWAAKAVPPRSACPEEAALMAIPAKSCKNQAEMTIHAGKKNSPLQMRSQKRKTHLNSIFVLASSSRKPPMHPEMAPDAPPKGISDAK